MNWNQECEVVNVNKKKVKRKVYNTKYERSATAWKKVRDDGDAFLFIVIVDLIR